MVVKNILIVILACQVSDIQTAEVTTPTTLTTSDGVRRLNKHILATYDNMFKKLKLAEREFNNEKRYRAFVAMFQDLLAFNQRYLEEFIELPLRVAVRDNTTHTYDGYIEDAFNEIIKEHYILNGTNANNTKETSTQKGFVIPFKTAANNELNKLGLEVAKYLKDKAENSVKVKKLDLKIWRRTSQPPASRRLFQARTTSIKEFPFMASVHVQQQFVCSGAVVGQNLVLTAASCLHMLYHKNPETISVRVASDFTQKQGMLLPADKVFFHPEFNPVMLRNNLALIRLKSDLPLRQQGGKLRRVNYERSIDTKKEKEGLYVLGWGARSDGDEMSQYQKLSYDFLDIYSFKTCRNIYSHYYLEDTNFCTGYVNKGNGACYRDVGGAGVRGSSLVGIISYGPPRCGLLNTPTVFTRIAKYTDWLDSIIFQQQPSPRSKVFQRQVAEIPLPAHSASPTPAPIQSPSSDDDYDEQVVLQDIIHNMITVNASKITQALGLNEASTDTKTKTARNASISRIGNEFQSKTTDKGNEGVVTDKKEPGSKIKATDYEKDTEVRTNRLISQKPIFHFDYYKFNEKPLFRTNTNDVKGQDTPTSKNKDPLKLNNRSKFKATSDKKKTKKNVLNHLNTTIIILNDKEPSKVSNNELNNKTLTTPIPIDNIEFALRRKEAANTHNKEDEDDTSDDFAETSEKQIGNANLKRRSNFKFRDSNYNYYEYLVMMN